LKNLRAFRVDHHVQKQRFISQLQPRFDRLAPMVREARSKLRSIAPEQLIARSGCDLDQANQLRLVFFGRDYLVSLADFAVRRADNGEELSSFTQDLILTYLHMADGTPASHQWIGFRDLPNGLFYEQAFQGYTGAELLRGLHGNVAAFQHAAQILNGFPLELGDAAYSFRVLPRLRLAIVWWSGDEDFPPQARVLFEDTAPHYMSTEGLAILGSQLIDRMLKVIPLRFPPDLTA
jgi:hypothetical protein